MSLNQEDQVQAIKAALNYRRLIKVIAPSIAITVANPERLEPIKEAARELDAALRPFTGSTT